MCFSLTDIISGIEDQNFQHFSEDMFLQNTEDKSFIIDLIKKADLGIRDINIKRQKITEETLPSTMPEEFRKMLLDRKGSIISTIHNVYDK